VRYCDGENVYVVMGCDYKAHHTVSGISNCKDRGVLLVKFLNSTDLEILNRGNYHNFCSGRRLDMIDITLWPLGFLGSVKRWEVSSETSL